MILKSKRMMKIRRTNKTICEEEICGEKEETEI
jgi:hypothetical protein